MINSYEEKNGIYVFNTDTDKYADYFKKTVLLRQVNKSDEFLTGFAHAKKEIIKLLILAHNENRDLEKVISELQKEQI